MGRGLLLLSWRNFFCRLIFCRGDLQFKNDLTRLHQLEIFPRSALDVVRIVLEIVDLFSMTFVVLVNFVDFLLKLFLLHAALANSQRAAFIEHGKQEHRNRQQSEDADGDSRYQPLHYCALSHCFPYSSSVARSSGDVDSA